jgi:hypothetical protein
MGLTVSGEFGEARVWDHAPAAYRPEQYRDYGYTHLALTADHTLGPVTLSGQISQLDERHSILGARLDLISGTGGATSWFGDIEARAALGAGWHIGGGYRRGWTRLAAGGLRATADWLKTSAWSLDAARDGLFLREDHFALRFSQPLRIMRGDLRLSLPTSYDYFTGATAFGISRLSLAPAGQERDLEAAYALPWAGGLVSTNLYWRQQPGNFLTAPDDIGAAVRYSAQF